jgi:hypothetical protein
MRRVNEDGRVIVAGQRLRVSRTYAGQTVVIPIEDTVFRVLLNDIELSTHARKPNLHITRFKAYPPAAKRPERQPRSHTVQHVLNSNNHQARPEAKPLSMARLKYPLVAR